MSDLHRFARQLVESLDAHAPGALAGPLSLAEITRRILPYRACRRLLGILDVEDYELLLVRLVAGELGLATAVPPAAAERCRAELETGHPSPAVLAELEGVSLLLDRGAIEYARLVGQEEARLPPRPYALREPEPEPDQADAAPPEEPEGSAVPASEAAGETLEAEVPADAGARDPAPAPEPELSGPVPEVVEPPAGFVEPVKPAPAGEEAPPAEPAPIEAAEAPVVPQSLPDDSPAPAPTVPHLAAPPRCPHCASRLPAGRPVRFCPHCGGNVIPLLCTRCGADLEPAWRHCVLCGAPAVHDSRLA